MQLYTPKSFTQRSLCAQTLLYTDTFTQSSFHRQNHLHREAVTQAFIQSSFYTQKYLHREAFTHRRFYTQKHLHREAFRRRNFYTEAFYTRTFSYRAAFTHRSLYTQKLYTEKPLRRVAGQQGHSKKPRAKEGNKLLEQIAALKLLMLSISDLEEGF